MEAKRTPIASTVMEMLGPVPKDLLHEIEFDHEAAKYLADNIARREFNRVSNPYQISKGLDLPVYFVGENTTDSAGYWGMYLN